MNKKSMRKIISLIRDYILDIVFPKFCLNCGKEGSYLCQDCFYLIDISDKQYCPFCKYPNVVPDGKTCGRCRKSKNLDGLFCVSSYDNFIVKKMINQFKYEPFIKELTIPFSSLIIAHFVNLEKQLDFTDSILIPIPLHKKKLKQRGFNQAEEIAKGISEILKIPLMNDILVKIKQTPAQVELKKEKRQKNVQGTFLCRNPSLIKNRKILLVDDIFTTGATMEECARVLKDAGAKEIWGVVVAKG